MKTMKELFVDMLKDIYFAERQLLKALPKMARAAENPQLKQGFLEHREQTETHVERLQQVFELVGKRAQGKTCEAIQGLIQETEELLEEAPDPSAMRDAGLIACGQAVEHYEMARYRSLVRWAKLIGQKEAAGLLEQTLREEMETDAKLEKMSGVVAPEAMAA